MVYIYSCIQLVMWLLSKMCSLQTARTFSRREVFVGQGRNQSSNRSSTDQGGRTCTQVSSEKDTEQGINAAVCSLLPVEAILVLHPVRFRLFLLKKKHIRAKPFVCTVMSSAMLFIGVSKLNYTGLIVINSGVKKSCNLLLWHAFITTMACHMSGV